MFLGRTTPSSVKRNERRVWTPGVCPGLLVSLECLHEPGAFWDKAANWGQFGNNLGPQCHHLALLTTSRREKIDFSPHFLF